MARRMFSRVILGCYLNFARCGTDGASTLQGIFQEAEKPLDRPKSFLIVILEVQTPGRFLRT